MKPSIMLSTQGMPNNWSQHSETRFPTLETTSQGSSNDHGTLNSTQNKVLIPIPNHVQGSQFPIPQQRHMKSPNQTRNIASVKIENGVKDPMKHKKYRKSNVKRKSSPYRGVTKCKGRFESFLWDNNHLGTDGKKGKTVYIGGFKNEVEAARAHDLIAIKIWGKSAYTNFPEIFYLKEISEMKSMTKRECILAVRRQSKDSSTAGSDNISRNKEGTVSSSLIEQTADDALSNKRDNEACDPSHDFAKSFKLSTLEQHNRDQLEQHVTISPPFGGQQNHDGISAFARVSFEMEENNASGDTFPNLDSTTEQTRLLEIGQEYQALIDLQNQQPNIQEFEAPNLQVALDQRYEHFQHGFKTNTSSQCEKMVENENDLDKSQYLNLNNHNMEDQDWADYLNELWSKVEPDSLSDWRFIEDGTQL